jgi:hypothetical protein
VAEVNTGLQQLLDPKFRHVMSPLIDWVLPT